MDKIDFKKTRKDLYRATSRVQRVEPGEGTFLTIDGQGTPGGPEFTNAIQHLYPVTYTLKFSLKRRGKIDFVVPPLETLWYDDPADVPETSKWRWKLLVRVPDSVTAGQVQAAKGDVLKKKGIDTSHVQLRRWTEGPSFQALHVGPYNEIGPVYEQLRETAAAEGLALHGPGHEVYLSDPRRTAPEKLRTIARRSIVDG